MPPVSDAPDGVDEVGDVHHAVLQQVADTAVAVGEELGRVGLLDVLRDDEDRRLGDPTTCLDSGPDALVAERRREPDVDDGDVRLLRRDHAEQRVAVLDRGDHVEAVVPQQPRQPVAQEREVLGDHDAHGSSARTVVGPPVGARDAERTVERLDAPPEARQALAGRVRTTAAVVAHLGDKGAVVTCTPIATCSAPEYLPAFASASATTK